MTTVQRRSVAAMPAIQHAPSNGDLLNLPQGMVPTGATLAGAPSLGAPAPIAVRLQTLGRKSARTATAPLMVAMFINLWETGSTVDRSAVGLENVSS